MATRRPSAWVSVLLQRGPWAVAAVTAALTVVVVAWPVPAVRAAGPVPQSTPDAKQLYLGDCATCHGSDGNGTRRGPTLQGVGSASVDYYLSTGRMPLAHPDDVPARSEPAYSPEVIDALVAYVTDLTAAGGPEKPTGDLRGDVSEGGVAFRLQCAACHTTTGNGGALLHRTVPALDRATPVEIAEAIRVGPGQMPSFGRAAFDDRDVADVVAYVRYIAPREPRTASFVDRDRGGLPFDHVGPVAEGAVALLAVAALLVVTRTLGERG